MIPPIELAIPAIAIDPQYARNPGNPRSGAIVYQSVRVGNPTICSCTISGSPPPGGDSDACSSAASHNSPNRANCPAVNRTRELRPRSPRWG